MLSIKQKQVLGVSSIVALVAIALSVVHLGVLARVLLEQSRDRGELLATAVYHRAREVISSRESAYQAIRADPGVRSILQSAIYSHSVTHAAIVDPTGTIVAHSDPSLIGGKIVNSGDLNELLDQSALNQLLAVYSRARTLTWRQEPLLLNEEVFGEIQIGISTLLVRRELDASLGPAAVVAGIALVVAVAIAMLLSQIVLRPIHVIQSGLSRLGRGDLGVTLDLHDNEFKDLGDVFANLTAQLRSVPQGNVEKRGQLLELSRRLMALGRLTAGVAHEVKNPLNAMTIHLELLRQKLLNPSGSSAASHVDVIAREIRRLDDVVQGFLKFVRPEELTLQPVDLRALGEDVLQTLAPETQAARITTDVTGEARLPPVEADSTMLRQALLNLAKNAMQAMPNGGRLWLACSAGRDGRVELRVSDTGEGIPPEHLAKIFDLYFTTKEGGTGIGLSLVYRAIQLHHGDIAVESTLGEGTTFVVRLPAAR